MLTVDLSFTGAEAPDPMRVREALQRGMLRAVLSVVRRAKLGLTGRFLRVRTGRLRSSVTERVIVAGQEIVGIIGTNVFYGRIHELGAPHPWQIRPRRRRALRFEAGGRTVFARRVAHPGLQARLWLSTALRESEAEVRGAFERELERVLGTSRG